MILRLALAVMISGALVYGQKAPAKSAKKEPHAEQPDKQSAEQAELERSLSEAGGSAIEYARVLEQHLVKYPKSERRAEIERVLLQSAIDMKDKRRLVLFGVPVIEGGSRTLQTLDHVSRALLDSEKKEDQERALRYSKLLEEEITKAMARLNDMDQEAISRGRRIAEMEKGLARAYTFQSRATGNLGDIPKAIELARKGWSTYPSDEAGRELSRWLERTGDVKGAIDALAGAYAVSEEDLDASARRKDRERMAELASKGKVSESELGLALLHATDDATAKLAEHKARLMKIDPNTFASKITDFTLEGLNTQPLAMSSLKGKVVVLDFWATWCGPCRVQYPLYQETKTRFKDNPDVVFIAVNTDDERSVVEPFLATQKWSKSVYFDDGLGSLLRVSSIPTTIVLNREGEVYSRMNGFIHDRFVDMLSDRINEALKQN